MGMITKRQAINLIMVEHGHNDQTMAEFWQDMGIYKNYSLSAVLQWLGY